MDNRRGPNEEVTDLQKHRERKNLLDLVDRLPKGIFPKPEKVTLIDSVSRVTPAVLQQALQSIDRSKFIPELNPESAETKFVEVVIFYEIYGKDLVVRTSFSLQPATNFSDLPNGKIPASFFCRTDIMTPTPSPQLEGIQFPALKADGFREVHVDLKEFSHLKIIETLNVVKTNTGHDFELRGVLPSPRQPSTEQIHEEARQRWGFMRMDMEDYDQRPSDPFDTDEVVSEAAAYGKSRLLVPQRFFITAQRKNKQGDSVYQTQNPDDIKDTQLISYLHSAIQQCYEAGKLVTATMLKHIQYQNDPAKEIHIGFTGAVTEVDMPSSGKVMKILEGQLART